MNQDQSRRRQLDYNPDQSIIERLKQTPIIDEKNKRVVFLVTRLDSVIVDITLNDWDVLSDYESIHVEHAFFLTTEREEELSNLMNSLVIDKPEKSMIYFLAKKYSKLKNLAFMAPINDDMINQQNILFPGRHIPERDRAPVKEYLRNIDTFYIPVPVTGHENHVKFYLPMNCDSYLLFTLTHAILDRSYVNHPNIEEFREYLPYIDQTLVIDEYKSGKLIMTKEITLKIIESIINRGVTGNKADLYLMGGCIMNLTEEDLTVLANRCFDSEYYIEAFKYLSSLSKYEHVIADVQTRKSEVNVMTMIYRIVDQARYRRDVLRYRIEDLEKNKDLNRKYYISEEWVNSIIDIKKAKKLFTRLDKQYNSMADRAIEIATSLAEDNCVRLHPNTSYKRLKTYVRISPKHTNPPMNDNHDNGLSKHDIVNYLRILNAEKKYVSSYPHSDGYKISNEDGKVVLRKTDANSDVNEKVVSYKPGETIKFNIGEQNFSIRQEKITHSFKYMMNWISETSELVHDKTQQKILIETYDDLSKNPLISEKQKNILQKHLDEVQFSMIDKIKKNLENRVDALISSLSPTSPNNRNSQFPKVELTEEELHKAREKKRKEVQRNKAKIVQTKKAADKDRTVDELVNANPTAFSSIIKNIDRSRVILTLAQLNEIDNKMESIITNFRLIDSKKASFDLIEMFCKAIITSDGNGFLSIRSIIKKVSPIHQRYYNIVMNNSEQSLLEFQNTLIRVLKNNKTLTKQAEQNMNGLSLDEMLANKNIDTRMDILKSFFSKLENVPEKVSDLYNELTSLSKDCNKINLDETYFYNKFNGMTPNSPLTMSGDSGYSLSDLDSGSNFLKNQEMKQDRYKKIRDTIPKYSAHIVGSYFKDGYSTSDIPYYQDLDEILGISDNETLKSRICATTDETRPRDIAYMYDFLEEESVKLYLSSFIDYFRNMEESKEDRNSYRGAVRNSLNTTIDILDNMIEKYRGRSIKKNIVATINEIIGCCSGIEYVKNIITKSFDYIFPVELVKPGEEKKKIANSDEEEQNSDNEYEESEHSDDESVKPAKKEKIVRLKRIVLNDNDIYDD